MTKGKYIAYAKWRCQRSNYTHRATQRHKKAREVAASSDAADEVTAWSTCADDVEAVAVADVDAALAESVAEMVALVLAAAVLVVATKEVTAEG